LDYFRNTAAATTQTGPSTTIAAPQITSAPSLGGGKVMVRWIDNSTNESQFVVERMVNGVWQAAAATAPNTTSTTVTGLKAGSVATFRVKAVGSGGQTAASTAMNVTVR